MWILCTDVRDGRRMAFPQLTAAVSYDVRKHVDGLQTQLTRAKALRPFMRDRFRAEAAMMAFHQEGDQFHSELERTEFINAVTQSSSTRFDVGLRDMARRVKGGSAVEAIIWFNDEEWPVRAVKTTSSWDDVRDYTSREEAVPTDNLPSYPDDGDDDE